MKAIGFRCGTSDFTYVVLEGRRSEPAILHNRKLPGPAGAPRAELLTWLRKEIQDLLDTYSPDRGAFKRIEGIATPTTERIELEGVLQEACGSHSCNLQLLGVYKKQLATGLRHTGSAAKVNDHLSIVGLQQLNNATYGDAAIAALFSLPE